MQRAKTKQEIANEYGVHRNTFAKWLKEKDIQLSRKLITPKEQELIYETFGQPVNNSNN